MGKKVKFATQIEQDVLRDLKKYAEQADMNISSVVSLAVAEYIDRARLRPIFRTSMTEVLDDHSDLLERLAK